jgi:hypothetical protein
MSNLYIRMNISFIFFFFFLFSKIQILKSNNKVYICMYMLSNFASNNNNNKKV